MITQLRTLIGGIALAAGLLILTSVTAAPPLGNSAYKKAAEADIAQLQKYLMTSETDKRFAPTSLSMAMMLAMYAEATGDKALKEQSLKVADAVSAKNYKGALEIAKGMTPKPGTAPLPSADLTKLSKYGLDEVMSPFRTEKVGGLGIEKDMREFAKGKNINPAAVEVLTARTAVLLEYACAMPNDKAKTNAANTADWTKYSKDSINITKMLAEEAAKGKGASEKTITKLAKDLDGKCIECHNKFRE